MQNKMIGWFVEEVGKGTLEKTLEWVLEKYKVPMHVSNQIKAMWSTFVAGDEWLGHWQPIVEREVKQMAPSLFTSADERYRYWQTAQYDGVSASSSSPLVLRDINAIGRVKHSLT